MRQACKEALVIIHRHKDQQILKLTKEEKLIVKTLNGIKNPKRLIEFLSKMNLNKNLENYLIEYLGNLKDIEFLHAILKSNLRQKVHICVQVAIRYTEQFTTSALIYPFESHKCNDGLFKFLKNIEAAPKSKDERAKKCLKETKLNHDKIKESETAFKRKRIKNNGNNF